MRPSPPGFAELRAALAAAERWILPAECLLCRRAVAAGESLVCNLCRLRWGRLPEPVCPRCGQPAGTGEVVPGAEDCPLCAGWTVPLVARSAVWHEGGARAAVHALKYQGWWRVAEAMARVMMRLTPLRKGVTLIPVPLGQRRRHRRGYNQSERLARALGATVGLAVSEVLERTRETPTQTALPPEARRANVQGAFRAGRRPPRQTVLVDDVFTTGATLVSAAAALLEAGAERVAAVTFARAQG